MKRRTLKKRSVRERSDFWKMMKRDRDHHAWHMRAIQLAEEMAPWDATIGDGLDEYPLAWKSADVLRALEMTVANIKKIEPPVRKLYVRRDVWPSFQASFAKLPYDERAAINGATVHVVDHLPVPWATDVELKTLIGDALAEELGPKFVGASNTDETRVAITERLSELLGKYGGTYGGLATADVTIQDVVTVNEGSEK